MDWTEQLIRQLDRHWMERVRPKLDGLTDEEYLWEPVPGAWNIRPRGTSSAPVQAGAGAFTADFAFPEPEPPPVTTIAWRLAHLIVGVFGVRNAAHFGGPQVDYGSFAYAGTATDALRQLDAGYATWTAGVHTLDAAALARPAGTAEGPWAEQPMGALVLHINREAIHHGAEVLLLRDLFRVRGVVESNRTVPSA